MHDPYLTITQIAGWNATHPKPVKNLLDCHEQLELSQAEPPSWEGLFNPATVAETVQAQAQYTVVTGDAASQAVRTARGRIATALKTVVSENIDAYTTQYEQRFDAAAETYETAAALLPARFAANQVVTFDAEQFQAYQDAKAAAAEIDAAKAWLLSVAELLPDQRFNTSTVATEFLVLDPGSVENYAGVQTADTRGDDNAYSAINPVLLRAVKAGGTLRLALPSDATEDVNAYEHQRSEMTEEQWRSISAGLVAW